MAGSHLWADHYDGALEDFFALDPIAEGIVATVALTLAQTEQNQAMRNEVRNLAAYDYALWGAAYNHRLTNEDNVKAKEIFQSAIELDPDYAPACAGLGSVLVYEAILGWSPNPKKSLDAAFKYGKRALVLDDSLAKIHTVLGVVYLRMKHNELAVAEGRRAVALEPSNADAHESLAHFLLFDGLAPEALEVVQKALRFNPAHANYLYFKTLAFAQYMLNHYEAAVMAGEQAVAHNPDIKGAHLRLVAANSQLGRMDDAQQHALEVLRIDPGFSLQSYSEYVPFKRKLDLDHYMAGLSKVGLPK